MNRFLMRRGLFRLALVVSVVGGAGAAQTAAASAAAPDCVYYRDGYSVCGAILGKYEELDGSRSILGRPRSNEMTTPDGRGRFTHFEHGSIYWTPQTGAVEVHGLIYERWAALGWERSSLGYPVRDETALADNGRVSSFEGGSIYWAPGFAAAAEVAGAVYRLWAPQEISTGGAAAECSAVGTSTGGQLPKATITCEIADTQTDGDGVYVAWDTPGNFEGSRSIYRSDATSTASDSRSTDTTGFETITWRVCRDRQQPWTDNCSATVTFDLGNQA